MSFNSLAQFIDQERVTIVTEWETFARTLWPEAGLTALVLRDHADEILTAIVNDMKTRQSASEQEEKSKGHGTARALGQIGQLHATLRIEVGFKLDQMVAEYRALRASVLRLWERTGTDPGGVTRFNEAIDEALTVAVESFIKTTEGFRDQTLGILGHDLRNPLSGITTGAAMLLRSGELSPKNAKVAERMARSASRMNRMIGDLLDLTRTRLGDQIPVARVSMDLEPLCRQVIAELEGLHHPGGLRFASEGDLHGEWDGDRIAQILSNLVRNAIQHGKAGAPIDLRAEDDGDDVLLKVHNEGHPIPPTALTTMFEPMVRHVRGDASNTGLGLGLYIAFQVVMAHAGSIDVTSTPTSGTTFTVRLPRHPASPVAS